MRTPASRIPRAAAAADPLPAIRLAYLDNLKVLLVVGVIAVAFVLTAGVAASFGLPALVARLRPFGPARRYPIESTISS